MCEILRIQRETGKSLGMFKPKDAPELIIERADREWGDMLVEGYLKGNKVITNTYDGKGADERFVLRADDSALVADGADSTRVVFRVTDEFGNARPFATGSITLEIEGPAEILGENPFALSGGVGALWIRAKETPGAALLRAKHPTLGVQELRLQIEPAAPELA